MVKNSSHQKQYYASFVLARFHTTYILVDIGIDVMEFGLVENSLTTMWNRIKESHHGGFSSGKEKRKK